MALVIPRLYAIIDAAATSQRSQPGHSDSQDPVAVCEILLAAGVKFIQYRDKRGSSRLLFEASAPIAEAVRRANATLIVNDRADIALATQADGVHVGRDDLPVELARRVLDPSGIIGVSTHRVSQVVEADRSSADYVAFGPIFATQTKENPDPVVGLEGLREARELTQKPLVAIGGITVENARAAIEAGADSVAVIRDLLAASDIGARAREFLTVLGEDQRVPYPAA